VDLYKKIMMLEAFQHRTKRIKRTDYGSHYIYISALLCYVIFPTSRYLPQQWSSNKELRFNNKPQLCEMN
jgi:hypothetical protein